MARTPEQIRESKRLNAAKKRAENPEAVRSIQRNWHKRNKDRNCAAMRNYYSRRFFWGRAMKLRGEGRATARCLSQLWISQRGKCALTGRRLDRSAQLDHITSRARGGTDEKKNLRWLCKEANLAKRELSDEEFIGMCSDVIGWIGEQIQQSDSSPLRPER